MLDAFAGLLYAFFGTLAILTLLKSCLAIRHRKWGPAFTGEEVKDKLEATAQHRYRKSD
jgi:hypothetical protein